MFFFPILVSNNLICITLNVFNRFISSCPRKINFYSTSMNQTYTVRFIRRSFLVQQKYHLSLLPSYKYTPNIYYVLQYRMNDAHIHFSSLFILCIRTSIPPLLCKSGYDKKYIRPE